MKILWLGIILCLCDSISAQESSVSSSDIWAIGPAQTPMKLDPLEYMIK